MRDERPDGSPGAALNRPAGASRPALRHLPAAALSGLLSYGVVLLPEPYSGPAFRWAAGALFGLLVLAAWTRSLWRRAALVAVSTLIYRAAVWSATEIVVETSWTEPLACLVVGASAAALLRLATAPLIEAAPPLGDRSSAGRHLLALAAGALGGVLIGIAVTAPDGDLLGLHPPLLAGFAVWQIGYAAAYGPVRRAR